MIDICARLEGSTLDKDNCPRMDSERQVSVGLAREAKAEIERLRVALKGLVEWADEYCQNGQCPTYDAIHPAKVALSAYQQSPLDDVKDMKTWPEEIRRAHGIKPDR